MLGLAKETGPGKWTEDGEGEALTKGTSRADKKIVLNCCSRAERSGNKYPGTKGGTPGSPEAAQEEEDEQNLNTIRRDDRQRTI